jgi:hypothetical protein
MSVLLKDYQKWLLWNLLELAKRYGKDGVALDARTWQTLIVRNFALPSTWSRRFTKLIVVLPPKAEIFFTAPERFYIEKGLRSQTGKDLAHYFEHSGFNDRADAGFARFSFHLTSGWCPELQAGRGSTLKDLLDGLLIGMTVAEKER